MRKRNEFGYPRGVPENSFGSGASKFARWLNTVVPEIFPTDRDLARAVGVNPATVLRWRRGSFPHTPQLLRLCRLTDMDPGEMLKLMEHDHNPGGDR